MSKRKKGQGALLYILIAMGITGGITYFAVNEYVLNNNNKNGSGKPAANEEESAENNIKYKIIKKNKDTKTAEKEEVAEKAAPAPKSEPVEKDSTAQPDVIVPTPEKGLKSTFTPPKSP